MRAWLQDTCNGLHVRCRLMDCGMSREWAKHVAGWWEFFTRPLLYGGNMDSKQWWASRGVWGGIVAILAGLAGFLGYSFNAEDQAHVVDLILPAASAIGGLVAILGRVLAKKKVGKSNSPTAAIVLMVALSCLLPACATSGAGPSSSGSGGGITSEQAKAGAAYLESSVATLQKALDQAKATGDPDKVATAQAVLDKAQAAATAFKASLPEAGQDQWNVARSVLSAAVDVLGPMAVKALVAGS